MSLDIIELVEVFRSRRTPNGEAKPIGMGSNFTQPLDLTQGTALALTPPCEKSLDILELLEVFRSQRTPNGEAKLIGMGSNFIQPLDLTQGTAPALTPP